MKKEWVLTQDSFDGLLDWLDADRERAGKAYEAIRLRLIKIFTCRGCSEAEDLADETINRVVTRVREIAPDFAGDPVQYFYGVSHKVHLEYLRKRHLTQELEDTVSPAAIQSTSSIDLAEDIEPEYQCLERCLGQLPENSRDLVVRYYQQEKQAKIDHRKRLAEELGIAVNALRIRAHRIRQSLHECVLKCLEEQPAN